MLHNQNNLRRLISRCLPVIQWLPVSGTNRTGRIWRVVTAPSVFFVISTNCCVRNGLPTGIIMRPPGFNCLISGGGT